MLRFFFFGCFVAAKRFRSRKLECPAVGRGDKVTVDLISSFKNVCHGANVLLETKESEHRIEIAVALANDL